MYSVTDMKVIIERRPLTAQTDLRDKNENLSYDDINCVTTVMFDNYRKSVKIRRQWECYKKESN